MERSEKEISDLQEYRTQKHLTVGAEFVAPPPKQADNGPKNFHFFNYDPSLGPTDLSNVSLKRDDRHDTAVFSIPITFTDSARTQYQHRADPEFGLDIRTALARGCKPLKTRRKPR